MNWKEILAATYNITKKDVVIPKSESYKTQKNKKSLPNSAKFTGDKIPRSGDPSKVELNDWHSKNKEYEKAKKKEEKDTSRGSPLTTENSRFETLEDVMKGGKVRYSWIDKVLDISKESKLEEENKDSCNVSKVSSRILKEEGDLQLIAKECDEYCAIGIYKQGKEVESYKVKKEGHQYEELIPIGVWESKLSLLKTKDKK